MARIGEGAFRQYRDGQDRLTAREYMSERELIRLAVNDLDDKVERTEGIREEFSNTVNEVGQTKQEIEAQIGEFSQTIEQTNQELQNKASKEEVSQVSNQLENKASKTEVQEVTEQLTETPSYPVLNGEVGVVEKKYEYGDVRRYGALKPSRNDNIDDAPFFQNAIDSASALRVPVKVAQGIYMIKNTLLLPVNITFIGTGNKVSYRGQTDGTVIESEVLELFAPKNSIYVTLYMDNLYFYSRSPLQYSTCFSGFSFHNSIIKQCNFHQFDIVMCGGWGGGMGNFYENDCQHIGMNFYRQTPPEGSGLRNTGASGIVDGYITNNYINGDPSKNPTAFFLEQFASSTISKNYVDFFKYAFHLKYSADSCFISGNTIDIVYRGFVGRVSNLNITDNTFMHFKKSYASRFPNASQKMRETDWICISNGNENDYEDGDVNDGNYMSNVLVANNYVNQADLFLFTKGYLKNGIKVQKNSYVLVDKKVDFTASVGWDGSPNDSLMDVYIDDLMDQDFTTLPSAKITSTGAAKTFHNHRIRYNNKTLVNNAGTWYDMAGNIVTS